MDHTVANPDCVFIGCGPIGLWTAIQFKLYRPEWEIMMLEKYEKFQRTHKLAVNKWSFIKSHPDPAFQELLSRIPKMIGCGDLQERLLQFAIKIGIKRDTVEVTDVSGFIAERYPKAKYIIGSDGAHSLTRKQIFGDRMKVEKDIQYLVEVKYKVAGKTAYLDMKSYYMTLKVLPFFVTEAVHVEVEEKQQDQNDLVDLQMKSEVSLRFIVDKNTFDAFKHATLKTPVYLKDLEAVIHDDSSKLGKSIKLMLGIRRDVTGEELVAGTSKLTTIKLGSYRAERVTMNVNEQTFILVGDAAFGVPFFRSLNNGLLCGSELARLLSKDPNWIHPNPMQKYERYVSRLGNIEASKADGKGVGINIAKAWTDISGCVPWQMIYWTSDQLESFQNMEWRF